MQKQNYIIRIVTQDGKFTFRKCFLDDDGEIEHVSSESFTFKAEDMSSLKEQMNEIQEALSLPALAISSSKGGGWLDQSPFLDELEEE